MLERPSRTPLISMGAARSVVLVALLLLSLRWTAALTLPLAASAVLFLLLSPGVEALQNRGMSAAAAAALVVLAPMLGLCAAAVLAAPAAAQWLEGMARAIARFGQALHPLGDQQGATGAGARWLAQGLRSIDADIAAWAGREALPFALTAASVVMLTFFLALAQRSLLAGVLGALEGRAARVRLLQALRDAREGIGGYLRVMTVMNVALALVTSAVLWSMGMPDAPEWACAIALLLFIPYLGPLAIALLLLAAAPPFASSALAMAAPAAAFLVLHALEANILSPWMLGHGVRIGRPALLVAVIVGAWTWGAFGGVLAVPLLIMARAGLQGRPGLAVAKALVAGEDGCAPSLAATSSGVINAEEARASTDRVRAAPETPVARSG